MATLSVRGFNALSSSSPSKILERKHPALRVVPPNFDPVCTPIPPDICATLLHLDQKEHDALVSAGLLIQSCIISPFGAHGKQGPLKMSNFWDLFSFAATSCAISFGLPQSAAAEAASNFADGVALGEELSPFEGLLSLGSFFSVCKEMSFEVEGLALSMAFSALRLTQYCTDLISIRLEANPSHS